jgi:hypothetical protein
VFKKLTYKKKNRALVIITVLSAVLIYEAALKKTIVAYSSCKSLELQVQDANDAPKKMNELQIKNARMDMLLGNGGKYLDVQESILGIVTNYCHENTLVLEEFPTPMIEKNNGIVIETNVFTIEGGFNKLLNLIYLFEQKYKIGKVVSVIYQVKKENSSSSTKLNVTIYLQNINKQGHET